MMRYLLESRELSLSRGKREVLHGISVALGEGEILALIGPNGAGKSTLLQALAGLLPYNRGEIFFKGRSVKNLLSYRRKLAVVFQDPLLVDATVWENVILGLRYRNMGKKEINRLVNEWLERLGISALAKRKARELSGGESQRVSIARALVLKPEILFLDEPFANLDVLTRQRIREELGVILKEEKITAVMVTHDFEELPMFANRVAAIEEGCVVQNGGVEEILNAPVKKSLAGLVGMENFWKPGKVGFEAGGWRIYFPGGQTLFAASSQQSPPAFIGIRPEKINFAQPGDINLLQASVKQVVPYGFRDKLILDCGHELRMFVPKNRLYKKEVKRGDVITISIFPEDIHLLAG